MDWLLAGKGEMSDSGVKQSLNLDFMKEIIVVVDNINKKEKKNLPSSKKAEIVILLYETLLKQDTRFHGKKREAFLKDNAVKFISLAS